MTFAICIPTYNAGHLWKDLMQSISEQDIQANKKIIFDSGSNDDTVAVAIANGFDVVEIAPKDFGHGKTRQALIDYCLGIDICIFLTQDAILENSTSLKTLLKRFNSLDIGLVYGRQLPHKGAKTLEAHARLFNYPTVSQIRGKADIAQYGFKTIFCSNSFSAYRVKAFNEIGGFPKSSIMGEDTLVASKMICAGWKVAYVAEAAVYHSHSYTLKQEFTRYFDTGVFHAQNKLLYETYGKPTGEGFKYVYSEIKYCIENKSFFSLMMVFPKTLTKLLGFKLGLYYKKYPLKISKYFSMHKNFWNDIED